MSMPRSCYTLYARNCNIKLTIRTKIKPIIAYKIQSESYVVRKCSPQETNVSKSVDTN